MPADTRPAFRPTLVELEARDVPAWWTVTAPSPAAGTPGSTDATHTGSLAFNPEYTPAAGQVTVWADTPVAAAAGALRGTVTVTFNGQTVDHVFGPATVGVVADQKAFAVAVTGTNVSVSMEDLVGFAGVTPDYDYNDRSWGGVAVEPAGGMFATLGGGAELNSAGGVVYSGEFRLTSPDGDASVSLVVRDDAPGYVGRWHWEYTVENLSYGPPDPTFGGSVEPWSHFLMGATTSADDIADKKTDRGFFSGLGWDFDYSPLSRGQVGTVTFTTPPTPIIDARAELWLSEGMLAVAEGPVKLPGPTPTVSLNIPKLIKVNANNDNWKPPAAGAPDPNAGRWVSANLPGIPANRDYDKQNLWQDDPELKKVTVTVTGGHAGTLELTDYAPGEGTVSFWKDSKPGDGRRKTAIFSSVAIATGADTRTFEFYVEGTHESTVRDDITVRAKFTLAADQRVVASDEKLVTVTPVILDFSAKLSTPNIMFEGDNPRRGMTAGIVGVPGKQDVAGIEFSAHILNGGFAGLMRPEFVQNILDVKNRDSNSAAGAVNVNAADNKNFLPKPGSGIVVPGAVLDAGVGTAFYTSQQDLSPNPAEETILKANDSPTTLTPTKNNSVVIYDLKFVFKNHLVVVFADGSVYPLAYINWSPKFYATRLNPADTLVGKVDPTSVTTVDSQYTRSNAPPGTMSGTRANNNFDWQ